MMQLKKCMVGVLLGVLCWGSLAFAGPFKIDVGAVASFPLVDDGVTRVLNEVQLFIDNNTVSLMNLTGGLATVGTTGTFTDTGDIFVTAFLPPSPPPPLPDDEGFGVNWFLNGAFSLSGSFEVVAVDGDETTLSFLFGPGGNLSLFYNEADGAPTGLSVLDAPSIIGEGTVLIDNTGGTLSGLGQATGGFTFTAGGPGTDVFDGFFLGADPAMTPFADDLTMAISDGNIAQTTTAIDPVTGAVVISALTDGSSSLEMIVNDVPEPGTLSLLGAGLLGLAALTRRRLKRRG